MRFCVRTTFRKFVEAVRDMADERQFEFMTKEPGSRPTEVCPAPPFIARREPAVFDKNMVGVQLPERIDDGIDFFRFTGNLEAETSLLDHDAL